MTLKSG